MLPLHQRDILVPQDGIEPPHPAYKTGPLPLRIQGLNVGGNGRTRTYTLLRMKEVHDHYATLPYRNTLSQTDYCGTGFAKSDTVRNVFLYGRGVRERSEFYRLKAGYFTLKFHPRYLITLVTCHDRSPLLNFFISQVYAFAVVTVRFTQPSYVHITLASSKLVKCPST